MIVAPVVRPVEAPVFQGRRVKVPCRSLLTKILCCIPTIGLVPWMICELRFFKSIQKIPLGDQAFVTQSAKEHFKAKNSILKCVIFREFLEISLIVAALALGTLSISAAAPALIVKPLFITIWATQRAKQKDECQRLDHPEQRFEIA